MSLINKYFFPHFYRFFTARPVVTSCKTAILVLVISIFLLSLYSIFYPPNARFEELKLNLLANPYSAKSHFELAKFFQMSNDNKQAKEEFLISQYLATLAKIHDERILEESTKNLLQLRSKVEKLKERLEFWKKIAQERPDYRDAYIQIAAYAYQLKNEGEAEIAIEKALELDPNFAPAKKLKEIILSIQR